MNEGKRPGDICLSQYAVFAVLLKLVKKIAGYFSLARWAPFSHCIHLQTTSSSHKSNLIELEEQSSQPIFSQGLNENLEDQNQIQTFIFHLKKLEVFKRRSVH